MSRAWVLLTLALSLAACGTVRPRTCTIVIGDLAGPELSLNDLRFAEDVCPGLSVRIWSDGVSPGMTRLGSDQIAPRVLSISVTYPIKGDQP